MSRIVLFWDIDGTLLHTARAGIQALERAAQAVAGATVDLSGMRTAGMTDAGIAALVLEQIGHLAEPAVVAEFLRAYESELPAVLPLRRGEVLPGAREILEDLRDEPRVRSLMLTGNTREGAQAKFAHYGLSGLLELEGVFCEHEQERGDLARRAAALLAPDDTAFVIGDTPADVACAQIMGARAIAVAFGRNTADVLAAAGAWRAVERLPDPAGFRALIGLDAR